MNKEKIQSIDIKHPEDITKAITALKELRDDYFGDIPSTDVHSGPFKVRHAWFQSILFDIGDLERLHEQKLIEFSPQLLEEVEKFKQHITDNDFKKRMTTKEDIDLADSVLNGIIEELEK